MNSQNPTLITLDDILSRSKNNFDLVRIIAAISVIFGHAFALHPSGGWAEPVRKVFLFTYSGAVAVDVFFFLSGIFIAASYFQSQSAGHFIVMRIGRIWPGLAVCLLISTFLVGPIVTSLSAQSYFQDPDTYRYLSKNIKLQHIDYTLPGVFEENHYKSAVNGSLWTLPIEIRCYLMVLIFGVVGGFKHRLWGFLLAVFLIASVATNNLYISKAFLVSDVSDMRMPLIFLLGMICYINRSKVVIDWRISAAALVMALAFKATFIGIAAFYLFVLNTVLVLGATGQLFRIKIPGDYSYGIYIYGFVVQQCVAHFFPQFTSYPSLLLSIPFSLMLSILSWHFIEGPALKISHAASAKLKNGPTM